MILLSIDPGNVESGYVFIDTTNYHIYEFGKIKNDILILKMQKEYYDEVAIEMIASYGMAVGQSVFETCLWIGRFMQVAWNGDRVPELIYRKDVKMHLCHSTKAKDGNIAQALKDRFGDKGTKANKGYLYGFKSDCFSALAVAVTWIDERNKDNDKHSW